MSRLNHHNHHHVIVKDHLAPSRSVIEGHHEEAQNACPSIEGQPVSGHRGANLGRALPLSASVVAGGSALARQHPPAPLHLFLVVMHVVENPPRAIVVFRASGN